MLAKDALAGKVAVVTGAGTGIGVGICRALAEAGANVAVSYASNRAGGERTAEAVRERGRKAWLQACDVRDYDQVQRLFDLAVKELGRVDILVNNSGITEPHSLL